MTLLTLFYSAHIVVLKAALLSCRNEWLTCCQCLQWNIAHWWCLLDDYRVIKLVLRSRIIRCLNQFVDFPHCHHTHTHILSLCLINPCLSVFLAIHTSDGNSNGAPCTFPFLYNNTWHHSCLPPSATNSLSWCSTTENYDEDHKWGNCLIYGELTSFFLFLLLCL